MKTYNIKIKNLQSNEVRTKTMELSEELITSLDYKKANNIIENNYQVIGIYEVRDKTNIRPSA
jgi:hypothetical protein